MQAQRFGPYTLVHHLATGGMGELYLAQRAGVAGFSKQVVVKALRDDLANDDEFVEMFLDEGRLAGVLDHSNIVHIYELGEVDGVYFMAMEYVHGADLGSLLSAVGGPLEHTAAFQVLRDVCEGLAFAHDAVDASGRPLELVHRDINPANILVSSAGAVKIVDFGIAKVAQRHRQTRAGILKGKFGYLSPEQARGQRVDRRCDVYALGLLLFEMTTGRSAIPEGSEAQMLEAAAHGMLLQPTEVVPDYPRGLADIFRRCTFYRPEDRYQSVPELLDELLEFQLDQRLLATPKRLAELVAQHFGAQLEAQRRVLTPATAGPGMGFEEEPPTETVPRPPGLTAQATTADPLDLVNAWALDGDDGALDGDDGDVDTMVQQLRGQSTGESTQVLVEGGVVRAETEEVSAPLSYSPTEMLDERLDGQRLDGGGLQPQDTNEQATVLRHRLPSSGGLEDKRTELARPPRPSATETRRGRDEELELAAEDLEEPGDERLMYARTALFDSVEAAPDGLETVNRTGPPRRPPTANRSSADVGGGQATVHLPPRSSVPEDRAEATRRGSPAPPRPRDSEPRRGMPRWLLFVLASLLILATAGAAGYYTRLRRQEQQQHKPSPTPTAPRDRATAPDAAATPAKP